MPVSDSECQEPKDLHSILAKLASSSDELPWLQMLNGALRDGGRDAAEEACRWGGIRISIDILKSKRPEAPFCCEKIRAQNRNSWLGLMDAHPVLSSSSSQDPWENHMETHRFSMVFIDFWILLDVHPHISP